MASVTIAPLVGTTSSAATGRGHQSHLVYGVNSGQWWCAYQSAANVLTFRRSADFTTWSAGGSYSLTGANTPIDGRLFALAYLNKSATDIVHISTCELTTNTSTGSGYHGRVTLGATTLTTTNADAVLQSSASSVGGGVASFGVGNCIDVNGNPVDFNTLNRGSLATLYGNFIVTRATNADAGTSWTAGFPAPTNLATVTNYITAAAILPLGAGTPAPALLVGDNNPTVGNFTNLSWIKYTNQSSATMANVLAANVTSQNANDWGIVGVSATDVHVVVRSGANAFVHRRFNGTAWSNGATLPGMTTGHKAGSGLFLGDDGTDVWLCAIDSGAANKIQAIKWTAATAAWDAAWSDVETATATRNFITGYPAVVGGSVGIAWTQANGTNFDIVGTLYSVVTPTPTPTPTPTVSIPALLDWQRRLVSGMPLGGFVQ